jgi:phage FluMu protein Com
MSKICPKCKSEIDNLDFDVTATCSGSIYEDNIVENSWGKTCLESYDSDSLMSNVEFDNFRCPECSEILFFTESDAIKFMSEKDE